MAFGRRVLILAAVLGFSALGARAGERELLVGPRSLEGHAERQEREGIREAEAESDVEAPAAAEADESEDRSDRDPAQEKPSQPRRQLR
ncbi:MAG: hypothetical protein IT285_15715 [Bdellovibrionales bacterium]|nr:hypothetical protein [Bdellovibrionales bacterium]